MNTINKVAKIIASLAKLASTIMDEKALVAFLGQIMAQQHATQHFLSEVFCGGVLEKKQEILANFAQQKQFYLSKILPELLKGANLDWDPNDLLKFL